MDSSNVDVQESNDNYYKLSGNGAFFHIMRSICGIGWLMLPHVFQNIGWPLSIGTLIVIGLITTYALHVLVKNVYQICNQSGLNYIGISDAMREAIQIGPIEVQHYGCQAELFVDIVLILHHVGEGCINVIFVATILKHIFDIFPVKFELWMFMIIELVPLFALSYFKRFYYLMGFVIVFESLKYLGILCFIFYMCFNQLSVSKTNDDLNFQFPFIYCIGIFIYTLCPLGVLLNILGDIKHPKQLFKWYGSLNLGMLCTLCASIFIGIIGSAAYGKNTSTIITQNLPTDNIFNIIWLVICVLANLFNHIFCYYVIIDLTYHKYWLKYFQSKNRPLYEQLARIFVITILVAISVAINYLELIVCFVAYITIAILVFIVPPFINMCLIWENGPTVVVMRNIILMWFGVILSLSGLTIIINDLMRKSI